MEKPPEKGTPPRLRPATINTLTLLMTLVLCALVYVFVNARMQSAPPISQIQAVTPTAATPVPSAAPTQRPGIKMAVMLERLNESGLSLTGTDDEAEYAVGMAEAGEMDTLRLSLQNGYVRGFTLSIAGPAPPDTSDDPGEIEKALASEYAAYMLREADRLRFMLPKLLDALSPDGYFPPSTALEWVELACLARAGEKTTQGEEKGYTFVCACSSNGKLTLAVGS